jgi:hypothetical protein
VVVVLVRVHQRVGYHQIKRMNSQTSQRTMAQPSEGSRLI